MPARFGYRAAMSRQSAAVGVGLVLLLVLAAWWLTRPAPENAARHAAAPAPAADRPDDGAPAPPDAAARPAPAVPGAGGRPGPPGDDDEPDQLGGDAIAAAWAHVDLETVRAALPDNAFWDLGAPTTDEAEIERRARIRDEWNVAYGKVLSGTGTEEEIRAYFDERARISGDYVEFTTHLLDTYGEQLPERDVGLLQLARTLHLARLEEIPRRMAEALDRKRQQDEARARWLADEAAFNAEREGAGAPGDANAGAR